MNRRTSLWFIVALPLITGIGVAYLRHISTDVPWLPGERRDVWLVEASGRQSLYFTASFLPTDSVEPPPVANDPPVAKPVFWSDAEITAASGLLAAARETSSDARSFAREISQRLREGGQNAALLARIAALIVLVIFIISALSIIGHQLGISTGMIITFLPLIIIAWTIERLSILWEEEGPRDVLMQGGGSMLVAIVAYFLMQSRTLQHLTFNFPELNLVLLALILAMGQYTGYKLTELRRFAALKDRQG